MDQQQYPTGSPEPLTGSASPQGAPPARLEPIGETWAAGVSPARLGTRSGRFRWAIALGVVLIVALVTVGGAFVLSGAGGTAKSLTAGNAPKDTIMFVDLRTDLPGDQHENLADFLSHFPGFADRAQFDNAYDEILNEITSAISPDLTYTSAFQSWTTGELSLAVTSLGSYDLPEGVISQGVAALPTDAAGLPVFPDATSTPPSGVVIVALKDRSAGETWVSSEIARTGVAFSPQNYAGTTLYVAKTATDGLTAAYAFTDKVLVAGDVTAVKAALDAPAKGSLADSANYQAAMNSFSGDSVATFYADTQALMQQLMSSLTSSIYGMAGLSMSGVSLTGAGMPAWIGGSVRAESDHMTVEMTMPKARGALNPGNGASVLAQDVPGSTVAVLEVHSVGQLFDSELTALASTPSMAPDVKQVQDVLETIGGIDWIGDADMVLTRDGSSYGGGLVIRTPDSATATTKEEMITNLITLAGGSSRMGITNSDETYKGTTITLVSVPSGDSGAPVRFGIAAKGDLIVAGYEDSFVKAVLDTTASSSLASQANYQAVMAAAGSSNYAYGYFDISAVADQIGQAMFPDDPGYYNLNYKPYLDHVGGAAFASIDGSTVTLRFVVTAR